MKMTHSEILISAFVFLFFSGCNPAKFSSNLNINSTLKKSETSPEKEAIDVEKQLELFSQAIDKMGQNSSLLTIQDAASTKWTYLGYRSKILATNGRSSFSNILSRTQTQISFSELRQEQCPTGMMCLMVYQPYVEAIISNQCQNAVYRMSENLVLTASMAPRANYRWTVVSGQKKTGCENEDESLFTTLSEQTIQNDPLIFISDRFLYIQSSSITYIFSR